MGSGAREMVRGHLPFWPENLRRGAGCLGKDTLWQFSGFLEGGWKDPSSFPAHTGTKYLAGFSSHLGRGEWSRVPSCPVM